MFRVDTIKFRLEPRTRSVLSETASFLEARGVKAYIVGGFIRDRILERSAGDIDIAVSGDAIELCRELAADLDARLVPLDEVNRVCRLVIIRDDEPRVELDFATLRGNIEQDLGERDFTINAIAAGLADTAHEASPEFIDPFQGRRDLRERRVRAVSERSLTADPVRLLRGVRLAAELDFAIEPGTEAQVKEHSRLIAAVPGERVREELVRLLSVPDRDSVLLYLDDLGLLTAIIPELAAAKGVEQPKEHFWDVFNHLVRTPAAADFLLRQGDWPVLRGLRRDALNAAPWSERLAEYFNREVSRGTTRRVLVKMAALLHDIAKPQTKTIEHTGRTRFFGHGLEGSEIAAGILERLRFSTREVKLVEGMVKHHMRPGQLSQEGLPTRRAIYRYFRDIGDAAVDTLFLGLADHLAARGPRLDMAEWRRHARLVEYVLAQYFEPQGVAAPPRLITGHDLIEVFELKPGPAIGNLLEAVREAQAAGEITSREEALAFVRRQLEAG